MAITRTVEGYWLGFMRCQGRSVVAEGSSRMAVELELITWAKTVKKESCNHG